MEKTKEQSKKFLTEFKQFIQRGNVVDMAVGVIIGSAFGKIVTSIVDDILMPLIGVIIGGIDLSNLTLEIGDATIKYGVFINNIINFLIIAFCVFMIVKILNKITNKKPEPKPIPKKSDEVILLEQIRDELVKQNK